jgi:hypothetical protein
MAWQRPRLQALSFYPRPSAGCLQQGSLPKAASVQRKEAAPELRCPVVGHFQSQPLHKPLSKGWKKALYRLGIPALFLV